MGTGHPLSRIISKVESDLSAFYGFQTAAAATDHLVSREQLQASLGDSVMLLPEFRGRAGVYLVDAASTVKASDLFIGIHLDAAIQKTLIDHDPTLRLDDTNLDAFCVLTEEISHFHLILNRANTERGVSKLELEWQGEIDKLLICAVTLHEQQGDLHLLPLARRLFDSATIVAENHELYWQATKHAARFWYAAVREHGGLLTPQLREVLRRSYYAPWAEKPAHIAAVDLRVAS